MLIAILSNMKFVIDKIIKLLIKKLYNYFIAFEKKNPKCPYNFINS